MHAHLQYEFARGSGPRDCKRMQINFWVLGTKEVVGVTAEKELEVMFACGDR